MPVTNEQFLFSCIEHTEGGTIDWQTVADECDIPSKGAASIKYRRLKAKYGAGGSEIGANANPKPEKSAEKKKPTKAKKRKIDLSDVEDDDNLATVKDEYENFEEEE